MLRVLALCLAVALAIAATAYAQNCSITLPAPPALPTVLVAPPALPPITTPPPGIPGHDTSLMNGLVSYWRFDDGSGSSVADSMGSNTGTWNGTLGSQWTTGIINGGGSFDGFTNYVSIPNSASLQGITSTLTISAWIKVSSNTSNYRQIVRKGTASFRPWFLILNSSNKVALSSSNNVAEYTSGFPYTADSQWHLVTGTFDGTTIRMYLDGAFQTSYSGGAIAANTDGAAIGALPDTTQKFLGSIDEVGIWNRALSATEVRTLYYNGLGNPFCGSVCGFSY